MRFALLAAAAVFSITLLVGTSIQFALPLLLPSVAATFVDSGVFRSWAGLGPIETITQSGMFSLFFAVACWVTRKTDESQLRHQQVKRLLFAFVAGTLTMLLVWALAIRIPWSVVAVWAAMTLSQAAAGLLVTRALGNSARTWTIAICAIGGSLTCSILLLVIGYRIPAPLPDRTFTLQVPGSADPLSHRLVHIDEFSPKTKRPHPSVVIFHGVEGATPLARRVHYLNARAIRDQGYHVFFVRYFDNCDYDSLMLRQSDGDIDVTAIETIRQRDYEQWIQTACAAIQTIKQRDDIDEVAVIGYSLGCYVGTAAAAQLTRDEQESIQAVVGNFGGVWDEVEFTESFPPTQLYHGRADQVVGVENAELALRRLQAAGVEAELFVYPGQGHVPTGLAAIEIRKQTERFLRSRLMSATLNR